MTSVTSQNPTPSTANDNTFDSTIFGSATLYIPMGSRTAYATAEGWKNFVNVEEQDFSDIEDSVTNEDIIVTVQNGAIVVMGIDMPVTIEVYSLSGQLLYSGTETTIPMSEQGIYIVKMGNLVKKVML